MPRLPAIEVSRPGGASRTLPDGQPAVLCFVFYMFQVALSRTWSPTLDRLESQHPDLRCWELILPGGPSFLRRWWLGWLLSGRWTALRRPLGIHHDVTPVVESLLLDRSKMTVLLIDGAGRERWRGDGFWTQHAEDELAAAVSRLSSDGSP